jgi:hypothetical protein
MKVEAILTFPCLCFGHEPKVKVVTEVVFNDNDSHSSLNVAREKVGDLLLNMHSTLQNNSCNNISKCTVGCYTLALIRALR